MQRDAALNHVRRVLQRAHARVHLGAHEAEGWGGREGGAGRSVRLRLRCTRCRAALAVPPCYQSSKHFFLLVQAPTYRSLGCPVTRNQAAQ